MKCIRRASLITLIVLLNLALVLVILPATPASAAKRGVAVLMYHYVSDPPAGSDQNRITLSVSVASFRQQMKWLKDNGYHTIRPDDLFSTQALPDKAVLLTFDDGHVDNYQNAFPILKEFGFIGTFFLITDWVDTNRPGVVTWAQAQAMKDAGMSIEAHTRTHDTLAGKTTDKQRDEIEGSIKAIEKALGEAPKYFAYPYGSFDQTTLKLVRGAKIQGAFTTHDGAVNSVRSQALNLPRLRIIFRMTLTDFASLLIRATS